MLYFVTTRGKAGRKPVDVSQILNMPLNRELYTSMYHFGNEAKEYFEEHHKTEGYNGPAYGNFFIIDLDNTDAKVVAVAMLRMLDELTEYGIFYYLFSSGKKGFHLYIPKYFLKYPPELEDKWDIACKLFIEEFKEKYPELIAYTDESVYFKNAIIRAPFSLHAETGRMKSLLVYDRDASIGRDSITEESILNQFSLSAINQSDVMRDIFMGMPRRAEEPDEYFLDISRVDLDQALEQVQHNDEVVIVDGEVRYSFSTKKCIVNMYNNPNLTGMRHYVGLRIMTDLFERGWSRDFARVILKQWNSKLTEPLDDEHIDNMLQYFGRYTYTCNDTYKQKFCDKTCQYHRFIRTDNEYTYQGEDYIRVLRESLDAPVVNDINLSDLYPEFPCSPIKPDRGHTTVICGGSSSGKTTLMLNIMLHFNHINWLFMSYEMPGIDIAEKLWLNIFGDLVINEERKPIFLEKTKHIITNDDPLISISDIEKHWRHVRASRNMECRAIAIDYLQLIPARGAVATERAITIAKSVKELAKCLRVAPFVLSQVPKEMAGDGNLALPMQAPKDSGEITNLADKQINVWRPNRGRAGSEDNIITIHMAKDRHGQATHEADLFFDGAKYRISSHERRFELRVAS